MAVGGHGQGNTTPKKLGTFATAFKEVFGAINAIGSRNGHDQVIHVFDTHCGSGINSKIGGAEGTPFIVQRAIRNQNSRVKKIIHVCVDKDKKTIDALAANLDRAFADWKTNPKIETQLVALPNSEMFNWIEGYIHDTSKYAKGCFVVDPNGAGYPYELPDAIDTHKSMDVLIRYDPTSAYRVRGAAKTCIQNGGTYNADEWHPSASELLCVLLKNHWWLVKLNGSGDGPVILFGSNFRFKRLPEEFLYQESLEFQQWLARSKHR